VLASTLTVVATCVPRLHHLGAIVVFAEFGTGQVFWSFVWFTLFFIWIWLLIMVFSDVFRSPDLNGWSKAIWTIFIIVLPYLGVFVYLIARGHKMSEHAVAQAKAADEAQRSYIQSVTQSSSSPADELAKAADLRDRGVIDEAEFQAIKTKVLGASS
jgi:hypothetical protein